MAQRVLVVEDSPTQADHLRGILEGAGYTVELAADGVEGLSKAKAQPPDLIISDILMPVMDGLALCGAVKSLPELMEIPFVILTQLDSILDILVGLERGADNFITKPVADDVVVARVHSIFANRDSPRSDQDGHEQLVHIAHRTVSVSAGKRQLVELLAALTSDLNRLHGQMAEFQRQTEEYRQTLAWVERITDALARDRLVLHFQPILDLRQNRIWAHEVLVRMLDADSQLILPGQFLPAAQQSGLMSQIDRWVVRQAIRAVGNGTVGSAAVVAINLSSRSLTDRELLLIIQRELMAADVDPSRLLFEITETTGIGNMGEAAKWITAVKQLGCRFALDDFGIGYSTFDYLQNLPVDYIKIDGRFIRGLRGLNQDRQIVRAVLDVARSLGKEMIAESVEDSETLEILRQLQVGFVQGYFIGRPVAEPQKE